MACKHRRKHTETRKGDRHGQNVRLVCSCKAVTTGWHTELWKADTAWRQIQEDEATSPQFYPLTQGPTCSTS